MPIHLGLNHLRWSHISSHMRKNLGPCVPRLQGLVVLLVEIRYNGYSISMSYKYECVTQMHLHDLQEDITQ